MHDINCIYSIGGSQSTNFQSGIFIYTYFTDANPRTAFSTQHVQIAKYKPTGLNGDSDLTKEHVDARRFHDSHDPRTRPMHPQRETLMSAHHHPFLC
jgi:hypothetical protein